ncbi:chemotaxis protein CheV [Campylobacter hyointestinalis]|uniref:chemotaxis protein n=1 Tax=Campylobacter hyointestinalis TaxID=198 RepID=UPI0007249B5B|nr:chemotaxis protein [Campylobacter hyointestinalis]PPB56791.1 chemotaxis protein CheV [Campylobacter hyointestinalis subsp. hyointestinalis]CUU73051.1 chemotaxis protein CheV [Campylobacter hyointestinalis]
MFDDNILKTGSNEMELVDFRIFKQGKDRVYEGIYGVNVAKVKEIIKMPNLTELPGVPDYIEGIFDLRGVVIPVINLAKWMNIIEPKDSILKPRVIIAEFSDIFIGFIVHEAKRIRRINWKDIEPANFSGGGGNGTLDKSKITGVTRIENDEVLLILDLESIVEELGIYQPKIEMEVDEMTQLSGIALVLDDSLTARRLVGDALTKMGLRVVEAKDGAEGLEKINDLYALYKDDLDQNLRVIISDIEMPQMDGFHFAASLKEDNRFSNIPIIFNSSLSNEFSELHGKEAGADAYLTKFNATQLYKEVIKVIDAHKKYLDKR